MKRGTPEHPKIMELAEDLCGYLDGMGIALPFEMCQTLVCGLVERLHHFTARYAPAGDIGKHSNIRITLAIGWKFDPAWLIDAMERRRLLDTTVSGVRLYVHDWHDHSDDAADKWLFDKDLRYANGALPRRGKKSRQSLDPVATQSRQSEPSSESEPESSSESNTSRAAAAAGACVSDEETQIIDTSPSKASEPPGGENTGTPDDPSKAKPARHSYTRDFERWYAIYPVKAGKFNTSTAFGRALKRISQDKQITREQALDWLCKVTATYAASPKGSSGKYAGFPEGWLNGGHYDDDPAVWSKDGPKLSPPVDPKRAPVNTFAPRRRTEDKS